VLRVCWRNGPGFADTRGGLGVRGLGVSVAAPLSPREREVLQLAASGFSNPEIARQLCLSRGTVKAALSTAYAKLNANDRASAVAAALRIGTIA
jgi:DNA-binding NarL/FixJ family response regulator